MRKAGVIEPTPCELYGYRYLKGIRLLIAAELVRRHGIPQLRASRLAGVPQPLLNAFLHGRRYPVAVREVEGVEGVGRLIRSVAESIVSGSAISACELCRALLSLKGLECPETVATSVGVCR